MRPPRPLTAALASFGLVATLTLAGCSTKTPEVDTAEVSPDPSVKVPPTSEAPVAAPAQVPANPPKP